MKILRIITLVIALVGMSEPAYCCTSAIIGAKATRDGRPILWKHRDTDSPHGFIARHEAEGEIGYVGLYNGGDSTLRAAWMGMNDAGLAIMNTASYNLPQDPKAKHDSEGRLMARALGRCRTVDDFGRFLDSLPKPMGIEANFGVIDAQGNGAYFETSDFGYQRYDLSDASDGVLIRTNFSESGDSVNGKGYIRYASACHQLAPHIQAGDITPELLTEQLSRRWYHGLIGQDMTAIGSEWMREGDYIPRRSSAASIAIEGMKDGESPDKMVMWTLIGWPPASYCLPVTLHNIPEALQPTAPGWHSPLCNEVVARMQQCFPLRHDGAKSYIHIPTLQSIDAQMRPLSEEGYRQGRQQRNL